MTAPSGSFAVTRALVERLDDWVNRLALPLLPLVKVSHPDTDTDFHWEFAQQTPLALLVAKSVRMVSGLRAALLLADAGLVTESASILRMVSDFASEIQAVGEGINTGQLSKAQREFVEQFFAPIPTTQAEFLAQDKAAFVSREELMKALVRLANQTSQSGELYRDTKRQLNRGFDAYVHGYYVTAMELYDGNKQRFLTRGTYWAPRLCLARNGVAGKLHEVIASMEFIAFLARDVELHGELRGARHQLEASQEESRSHCG